jgi:hypothetical protein
VRESSGKTGISDVRSIFNQASALKMRRQAFKSHKAKAHLGNQRALTNHRALLLNILRGSAAHRV